MKVEIKIPSFGESVVEATISNIFKPTGASVSTDEEVLELETDKLNQVLYAPATGEISLLVKVGDVVKIGQIIGTVDTEKKGAAAAPPPPAQTKPSPPLAPPPPLPKKEEAPIRKSIDQGLQETPEPPKAPSKPPPLKTTPKEGEVRKKMSKLRRVIAERLVEVKNQTAMLTTFNEVDMSTVMAVREKEQEAFQKKHGIKLGFMSFFIKATVAALEEFPEINGRIEGDEIVYPNRYDIGVAVGTDQGLMVPVIRRADLLSYAEIEKALKGFADKARSGSIQVDDLQGGTFTISNGGVYGSLLSTPILNPPQSGILGMHNIVKRPIAVGDQVVIRPMMYLALSYDHRIVDGKEAISFLVHIKRTLEEPTRLLLDV